MTISDEQVEWLEGFFTDFKQDGVSALSEGSISKKSYDFAVDQEARFNQYRKRMYLSEKQEQWLRNIADDMAGNNKPPSGSAQLRPDNRASKLGREIGPGRPYTKEELDDDIPF